MSDILQTLKSIGKRSSAQTQDHFRSAVSGEHRWHLSSNKRPTYCGVCREALSGVVWHGLSCEVCKAKAHKRCATLNVLQSCKWTTFKTVGKAVIYDENEHVIMPHQWMEGNLSVSAKCAVCDKTCGSVLRLQDWRCLWCKITVHNGCKDAYPRRCSLGPCKISVLPPVVIKDLSSDGTPDLIHTRAALGSPLLVLVNSKSGDNRGVKFLRRFRQLLNPAQVYDLADGGPDFGLNFFKNFDTFRILVCGGDGSVGWVLSALDKMDLHSKCQIGVLPFGTGNDLARVLGWGNALEDEAQIPTLLTKFERAQSKMLDRWSILVYEGTTPYQQLLMNKTKSITAYEDSVAKQVAQMLSSDDNTVVISSAKILCETVKDFVAKVGEAHKEDESDCDSITKKCTILQQKLDSLLNTLHDESLELEASCSSAIEADGSSVDTVPDFSPKVNDRMKRQAFHQREKLMCRANSLKKAVRQIIEQTERAVDEQNEQTAQRHRAAKHHKRVKGEKNVKHKSAPCSPTAPIFESSTSAVSPSPPGSPTLVKIEELMDSPRSPEESDFSGVTLKVSADTDRLFSEDSDLTSRSLGLANSLSVSRQSLFGGSRTSLSTLAVPISPNQPDITLLRAQLGGPMTFGVNILPPTPAISRSPSASSFAVAAAALNSAVCPVSPVVGRRLEVARRSEAFLSSGAFTPQQMSRNSSSSVTSEKLPGSSSQNSLNVRQSASESSFRDSETSPNGSRKISSISTMRSFGRSPSPQRSLMPAFRRGLIASGLCGGSLIAEVLLLNADVLGVAASPMMDFVDVPLDQYSEPRVMNNYFGIGLDAKISLEFNNKRDEYSHKSKSRSKLYMWYGMLGTKELMQRTYKNLEQVVHLECDGHRIQLPSLQGIVVLNIPSYAGGSNFWGHGNDDGIFTAQSFDDKVLEVMAVFGVIHCATSRVISLQNHRIAQCRHVKITITGDEPIPVQVDGEAWMQPPGYIQIQHKNRAQVLVRNRQFEATLKTWTERQNREQRPPSCLLRTYDEEGSNTILNFLDSANIFVSQVRKAMTEAEPVQRSLAHIIDKITSIMLKLYPTKKLVDVPNLHFHLLEVFSLTRILCSKIKELQDEKSLGGLSDATKESLETSLISFNSDLRECEKILMINSSASSLFPGSHSASAPPSTSRKFRLPKWMGKQKCKTYEKLSSGHFSESDGPSLETKQKAVSHWSASDVCEWLRSIDMAHYGDNFAHNDIRGPELMKLERSDLKELGILKLGHILRIEQAIQNLAVGQESGPLTSDSFSSL